MSAAEQLCEVLAQRSGTNAADWHLVYKARFGMYVAFDAIRAHAPQRTKVLTQLFTCCTAVDPIVAAGLVPLYGDISAATLALDLQTAPISEDVAAVVLQHTFGVFDCARDKELAKAAHAAGALVIEDNAHAVGVISKDGNGTPIADISIHSFGVEKMLPTYFGGAVWINPAMKDEALKALLTAKFEQLPELDATRDKASKHYLNQIRTILHLPHNLGHSLRVRLEAKGAFEPAVAEVELKGKLNGTAAKPSTWVCERALDALKTKDATDEKRKRAVAIYQTNLAQFGAPESPDNAALLKYCVFAPDSATAEATIDALNKEGIYTVPWYRPVLYPGVTDEAAYSFNSTRDLSADNTCLQTTRACSERAVCLPTDVDEAVAQRVCELVTQFGLRDASRA